MRRIWFLALAACGGSSASHPDGTVAPDGPAPDAAPALALRFERTTGAQDFTAIATLTGADDPITFAIDRGTIDASGHVSPPQTGEYTVTATTGALSVSRTALVLGEVDDAWGQPEPVPGLANTPAWEDGASISPDGSVLTIQYLPVSIACLTVGDPSGPACAVIGPVAAPARPEMPGANRVHGAAYENDCPSIGVPDLPSPLPPNSLYALHREADDSFGDPHPIYYAGADGCIGAFGLQLRASDAVWAFDDPRHPYGDGARVLHGAIDPSNDVVLGTFSSDAGNLVLADEVGIVIGDEAGPTQGNPNLWDTAGGVVLFSDDEQGREDLFFNLSPSATGAYLGQQLVPSPVSIDGAQESQPFFDGATLYFRRDLVVLASDHTGGDFGAGWSQPRTILAPGPTTEGDDHVLVVGEPSTTLGAAPRELYFIYGLTRADGTADLNVGRVAAR
ncbi:MAG TPA: hypothetical protein VGM88_31215 [Kofleriaceae bacterium]|jgi:hypothetical protein